MNLKTAGRTLDLFEAFAREGEPLSLSGLARAIGAQVSSYFGIVRTQEAGGYLYEVKARGETVADLMAVVVPVAVNGEPYSVVLAGPMRRMDGALKRHAKLLTELRATLERET